MLKRGGPTELGFIRHTYRPFDTRWLYWEPDSGLLDRPRPDYPPHVFEGNQWLVAQRRSSQEWSPGPVTSHVAGKKLLDFAACGFPLWLRDDGLEGGPDHRRPNLSEAAQRYLDRLGAGVEDLFHHVLAVLHDPAYREANAGALRMGWPRIPLPGWPDGDAPGAADELAASAVRGRELAALLDSDTPVPGVTAGALPPEIAAIAVPATVDGGNMAGDDFALKAGWGHFGQGDAVMPGQGRVVERSYTADERAALGGAAETLGETTFDVYVNGRAYWRNVPVRRLELQARRLPGAQEVALVPRARGAGEGAAAGGGAALHGHGAADWGGAGGSLARRPCRGWGVRGRDAAPPCGFPLSRE